MELRDMDGEINRAVGSELRAARARRGLTRPQLAAASGLAVSTIQRFENGERSPDMLQLHALCNALGISPQEIVAKTIEVVERHRE
ncbi:helix-turn-helix domain-containing protein [Nocardia sp. CDC159]|uniref:Helix-turn-helix domain-containing protein n=1 Tax=Nocardia pulmonis TaxID=2951408 RepID=A0A9X2EBE1_9NOCA|nr:MULTISPECIES: helix-turn-helix transcriptional regulator [Nocardia]MCM6777259.1 helix-turn-helix domain-containing protein [Nocardia pulmonis]MCM6790144.1 helix-turn-helix domain-containing protein [Nocardia sp. CDC159]